MRYLAIDLGDVRTGLAVGDDETGLVGPAGRVQVPIAHQDGGALIEALARAVDEHLGPADSVVMGLPINMDSTEGPRAQLVRAFAARLAARIDQPILFQDERLTTAQADWTMGGSGLTHKQRKNRRDALAACAILGDFLAARARQDDADQADQGQDNADSDGLTDSDR